MRKKKVGEISQGGNWKKRIKYTVAKACVQNSTYVCNSHIEAQTYVCMRKHITQRREKDN